MRKSVSVLIVIAIINLHGCSTRQMYEAIQNNQRFQCQKAPLSEYDECIKRMNDSHNKYKQIRDEAVEKK